LNSELIMNGHSSVVDTDTLWKKNLEKS